MDNNNIYKKFRDVGLEEKVFKGGPLNKRFDEPTYFSFRLRFAENYDIAYNNAANNALYDTMPHPLFKKAPEVSSINKPTNSYIIPYDEQEYSSTKYLENANEPTRAQMLREFIGKFNDLQDNYPYYFQSIDGISELLKIDTAKGQRILDDKRITITCLEGLDLRMSYLLNLYRKIAWDDVYQRWVLPDMMRYFTLNIYLAEFRTFHTPSFDENTGLSQTVIDYIPKTLSQPIEKQPLYLVVLDDILPAWQITCEMCEFDINTITFEHANNLSVANVPNQGAVKFGIKVGNIKELQIYPIFNHKYLIDRKLNGVNRAREEITTAEIENKYHYPAYLQIAQNRSGESIKHESGLPYLERSNENNLNEADLQQEKIRNSTFDVNFKPTEPNTWVGNAINFGTSYAQNFVDKIVDKAKIYPVPKLGISFSEVSAVLAAKDVIGALGLIRKGINEVVKEFGNAPSSRLEQPIQTDNIMYSFLSSITKMTKSDATDTEFQTLQSAANLALSDKGVWEKIKDYSLATDLVGKGETNTTKNLQGTIEYQSTVAKQSAITSTSREIETKSALPTMEPNAASRNLYQEPTLIRGNTSKELSNKIKNNAVDRGTTSSNLSSAPGESEMTRGESSQSLSSTTENSGLKTEPASNRLSSKTEVTELKDVKASVNLSELVEGGMKQTQSSSGLSSQIQDGGMKIQSGDRTSTPIENSQGVRPESAGVRIKTIDMTKVIEAQPTTSMNRKIEEDSLKQSAKSKATTNKIEEQNLIDTTSSRATDRKIEKQNEIEDAPTSKSTNQELFSP